MGNRPPSGNQKPGANNPHHPRVHKTLTRAMVLVWTVPARWALRCYTLRALRRLRRRQCCVAQQCKGCASNNTCACTVKP